MTLQYKLMNLLLLVEQGIYLLLLLLLLNIITLVKIFRINLSHNLV
jgi:hypothetical protein